MGYAFNGKCYGTDQEALAAFAASMSGGAPGALAEVTSASIGNGLVTWEVEYRDFAQATSETVSGTTQLIACDSPLFNTEYAIQLAPFAVLLLMFALGWIAGHQR